MWLTKHPHQWLVSLPISNPTYVRTWNFPKPGAPFVEIRRPRRRSSHWTSTPTVTKFSPAPSTTLRRRFLAFDDLWMGHDGEHGVPDGMIVWARLMEHMNIYIDIDIDIDIDRYYMIIYLYMTYLYMIYIYMIYIHIYIYVYIYDICIFILYMIYNIYIHRIYDIYIYCIYDIYIHCIYDIYIYTLYILYIWYIYDTYTYIWYVYKYHIYIYIIQIHTILRLVLKLFKPWSLDH